jgi:WD40 repeat protein
MPGMLVTDGDILSWSDDNTLRIWNAVTGACSAIFEGHTGGVNGRMLLMNGDILSWSDDDTPRVWNATTGVCSVMLRHNDAPFRRPDLSVAQFSLESRCAPVGIGNAIILVDPAKPMCIWEAVAVCRGVEVVPDGTVVTTLDDGHVFLLKLHYGARRVNLEEARDILARPDPIAIEA